MIQNYSSIKSSTTSSQQIRHHLQLVFIYYSSFADRNNYHLLKHQNYRRFLIDSQIVKSTNDFPDLDILFKKISKTHPNALNFQEFLNLLPQLALNVYQGQTRSVAFKRLIKQYIKKLQVQVRQNSEFGQDLSIIQQFLSSRLSKSHQGIFLKLCCSSILKKSFNFYISSTSMHQKNPSSTFQSLYKFLKSFSLSPQLIYKSICYVSFIILLITKPQDQRNSFTFQCFIKFILLVAEIITKKEINKQMTLDQRICRVLEKMEISQGFQTISKLVKGETYFSMSLVRILLDQHGNFSNQVQKLDHSFEEGSQAYRHKRCSIPSNNLQRALTASYDSLNTLANQPQQFKLIKKIFEDICAFGEVGNNKTLKSIKIKKLFGQTGLLKVVNQIWLDLSITQLIRQSSTGKIQFLQFVQLLNMTAKKLKVDENQVYNLIINNSSQGSSSVLKSMLSQQDRQLLMQMLQTISYALQRVFHFYSKSKNQISFGQMTKLMYDFEIFPSILSKNKLYQIFIETYQYSIENDQNIKDKCLFIKQKYCTSAKKGNTSSSRYHTNSYSQSAHKNVSDPHANQQKLMHITCFPSLLIKCSNQICQNYLTGPQKLIILLEKMHQSKGQQKVVIGKGSLVSQLRKNYPNVYKLSFASKDVKTQKPQNVDDLLDDISQY